MPSGVEARSSTGRLAPVEGLRAIAALGVIWWHTWIFTGNPALVLQLGGVSVNLQRGLVLLGSGFNLFFVISGFCLYLSLSRWRGSPLGVNYLRFLQRRWWRLAPLFYAVCICTCVGLFLAGKGFSWQVLLAHLLFLHLWWPGVGPLASPFWTLQVEWEFYVLLPLILWAARRPLLSLSRVILLLGGVSLAVRYALFAGPTGGFSPWQDHLGMRFVEFGWGLLVAEWVAAGKQPPRLLRGTGGAMLALFIAYLGRTMMTGEVARWAGAATPLVKTLAEPVLTLGFALLLWNVAVCSSGVATFLSSRPLQKLGQWSYGLYLWHWYVCLALCTFLLDRFGISVAVHYGGMMISLAVLIPLSALTYRLLEQPFLTAGRKTVTAAKPAAELPGAAV